MLTLMLRTAAGEAGRRESEVADLQHKQGKQWPGASLFPRSVPGARGRSCPRKSAVTHRQL